MTIVFADSPQLLVNKSMATSWVSDVVSMKIINASSFKMNWMGSFTGLLKITFCNDEDIVDASNPPADIIWNTLITLVVSAGFSPDADTFWFADIFSALKYLRVEYIATSGTGSLNCKLHSKSFG